MEYQLCPSILSADFNRLGEQIRTLAKEGVKWLHMTLWTGILFPAFFRDAGDPYDPEGIRNVF